MPGHLLPEKVMPLLDKFKVELTKQLGGKSPNYLISNLKKPGGKIELPDGSVICSEDCLSPDRPGRKLVILGDTSNPYAIAPIANDCDLLIHEATNACLKV